MGFTEVLPPQNSCSLFLANPLIGTNLCILHPGTGLGPCAPNKAQDFKNTETASALTVHISTYSFNSLYRYIPPLLCVQVVILEHKSIICAGYSAVCHIHSVAEEVTVKLLLCTLDKKSGDKSQMRPRFVKQDQIAIMRFETSGVICMEAFKDHPQLGRFTLRDEGEWFSMRKLHPLSPC